MNIYITAHVNNRKKEGIEKDMFGEFHVYTPARPQNSEANKAIILLLAKYFNVASSSIILKKGTTGKVKCFEILSKV